MKKVLPFILILLCVLAFTMSYVSAERGTVIVLELPQKEIITEAKLPESLTIVEDEAFEGTALIKVELPETVEIIGERAFANISSLREISIPIITSYIASTAFEGSNLTVITAPANSYARTFAKEHGIPFSPIIMFCASTQTSTLSDLSINRSTEDIEGQAESDFKPETQWRRIEEINVIRTEELIANHVQGRSPPMA